MTEILDSQSPADKPQRLFVRLTDLCDGRVTATTYPFPGAQEYVIQSAGTSITCSDAKEKEEGCFRAVRAERLQREAEAKLSAQSASERRTDELRYAVLRRWLVDENYCVKGMPQAQTLEEVDALCDAEIAKDRATDATADRRVTP